MQSIHTICRFIESGCYLGFMDALGQDFIKEVCALEDKHIHPVRVFTPVDFSSYSQKMDSKTGINKASLNGYWNKQHQRGRK